MFFECISLSLSSFPMGHCLPWFFLWFPMWCVAPWETTWSPMWWVPSVEKTECLFVKHQEKIRTDDLFKAGNAKAQNEVLTHKCEACSRGFSTHQGLKTHEKIWCGWADRLDSEKYEVNRVLEARGSPEHRFYLVSWKGYPNSENSWIPALWAEGAQKLVDQFWNNRGLCQETAGIPEAPWTDGKGKQKLARCFWCCKFYCMLENKT